MAEDNNGAQAPQPGAEAQPQRRSITILAQYIKDLSFENPRAPMSLLQPQQPQLNLNVDVKAAPLGDNRYEVVLTVHAVAQNAAAEGLFVVELSYAAVVALNGVNADETGLALLVETPRLIFPFARAIVADATRDGGFPPVFLQPIDFLELLRRQQAANPATA
jgi:preprotein translocase subunit SecB